MPIVRQCFLVLAPLAAHDNFSTFSETRTNTARCGPFFGEVGAPGDLEKVNLEMDDWASQIQSQNEKIIAIILAIRTVKLGDLGGVGSISEHDLTHEIR